jgi:hypothetical protein
MVINSLLELYTMQASPDMLNGDVLNAPRAFSSRCHIVPGVSFAYLPEELAKVVKQALWTIDPVGSLQRLVGVKV